jgi:uncharacterized FlaG/YvyC family protein
MGAGCSGNRAVSVDETIVPTEGASAVSKDCLKRIKSKIKSKKNSGKKPVNSDSESDDELEESVEDLSKLMNSMPKTKEVLKNEEIWNAINSDKLD